MNNQAYLFVIFIINGILIGILFDIFRILRKSFKTVDIVTYIQDVIFWILTGILTLYFIFTYNNGEIRLYVFLGIILGILLYILTISKYIIKFSVIIITFIKSIIGKFIKIIIYPFNFIFKIIKKVLFRPFSFVIINIRNIFTKNKLKINNFIKKIHKPTKNQI